MKPTNTLTALVVLLLTLAAGVNAQTATTAQATPDSRTATGQKGKEAKAAATPASQYLYSRARVAYLALTVRIV